MRMTAGILALALSGASQAAPNVAEARAIYDELGRTVPQAQQWSRKPPRERDAALHQADQLIARAERVFGSAQVGDGAVCRAAAISRKFFVIGLNDLAALLEGRPLTSPHDLYGPMTVAARFGEQLAGCGAYVEGLGRR